MSTNYQFEVNVADASGTHCVQTLEINVSPEPISLVGLRYWTMEEAGIGPRVDSVNGDNLDNVNRNGADLDALPGKVGNAVHFQGALEFPDKTFVTGLQPAGVPPPALPITPETGALKISTAFWHKLVSIGNGNADQWVQIEGWMAGARVALVGIEATGGVFSFYENIAEAGYNNHALAMPDNNWHFYHLFYDASSNVVGFSVDNGTETTYAVAPQAGGPLDAYWYRAESLQLTKLGATPEFLIDEHLVKIGAKLTPGQVASLYNGGAGRTWPIT